MEEGRKKTLGLGPLPKDPARKKEKEGLAECPRIDSGLGKNIDRKNRGKGVCRALIRKGGHGSAYHRRVDFWRTALLEATNHVLGERTRGGENNLGGSYTVS